jgi:RNA polymerase sigma-70 factor, ECF subfamily
LIPVGGMSGRAGGNPEGVLEAVNERLLLERIVDGDRDAFRTLYLAYHKRLSRFLLRFLRRHDLIEEVINDTLYAVWCKAGEFRGESQLSTWIFGIAYRKALKAVRKDSREPRLEADGVDVAVPVPSQDPGERQRELRESLDRALASLPAVQRTVIELAYFVGHSCEEIAAITTTPVNTIKTRMFHARERLRELLPEWRGGDER